MSSAVSPLNPLPFAESSRSTLSYQGPSYEFGGLAPLALNSSRSSDDELVDNIGSNFLSTPPPRLSASSEDNSLNTRREENPKLPLTSQRSLQGARALFAEMLTSEECPSSAVGSASANVTRTRAVSDGSNDYYSTNSCSDYSFKSPSHTRGANNSDLCCSKSTGSTGTSSRSTSCRSTSSRSSSNSSTRSGCDSKSCSSCATEPLEARPNPLLKYGAKSPGCIRTKAACKIVPESEHQSGKQMLEPLNGRMSWFPSASLGTPRPNSSQVNARARSFHISESSSASPSQEKDHQVPRSRSAPALTGNSSDVDNLDAQPSVETPLACEALDDDFCKLLSAALLEA